MKQSLCELLLDYLPRISEVEDFVSTSIANCVFNSFLSYTAIMLNIVSIHAIRKTSSLPKTLKTLLLSLAVSDVSVGLLVQPFYTSLLIKLSQEHTPGCDTHKAFYFIGHLFSLASFLGVLAVSVDRFLAIHLHLRYQELVTHQRVVAVAISIWVLSLFVSFLLFWVPLDIYSLIVASIAVGGLVLTTMIYIRIYLAARRHKNQIQVLQVQQVTQANEIANFASLMKSAIGIFYVYVVFLICYLPYVIGLAVFEIVGSNITLKKLYFSFSTIVFLNSSLNPVIYCWKMRNIRQAVINILRNMSWFRDRASLASTGNTTL
ncbi:adenosine receptor A2a-like [Orbicella faveolata]|uniref:adenosine receptor A2a-like n=1 Tax=Orbicella faveolata TaxID=48498 RepID=UPI0009E516F6|nr:adenosine receptor A2a-like [Orbicella faveolata]